MYCKEYNIIIFNLREPAENSGVWILGGLKLTRGPKLGLPYIVGLKVFILFY